MPKLAIIGDVHATFDFLDLVLDRIRQVDAQGILLVGDLGSHDVNFRSMRTPEGDALYRESVLEVLRRCRALGKPVAYVPGNHDLPDLDFDGNADHTVLDVGGLRVAGIGGAGPARFGFCYEWGEDDIRARVVPECDVLLCHTPPAGSPLGRTVRGDDAGSEAIRELAQRHTGFLVCGHIHEAAGTDTIGHCVCLNAGGLGQPFGKPRVGWIERGESGDRAWVDTL